MPERFDPDRRAFIPENQRTLAEDAANPPFQHGKSAPQTEGEPEAAPSAREVIEDRPDGSPLTTSPPPAAEAVTDAPSDAVYAGPDPFEDDSKRDAEEAQAADELDDEEDDDFDDEDFDDEDDDF